MRTSSYVICFLFITLCYIFMQLNFVVIKMGKLRKQTKLHDIPGHRPSTQTKPEPVHGNVKLKSSKDSYFYNGKRLVHAINCKVLIEGDHEEITRAKLQMKQSPVSVPTDVTVAAATQDCDQFRQIYGYDDIPNTNEELDFPIAFNILLYKDVAQVEMLLRAIYKPQNYYCLHVDGFSPQSVHTAASNLAKCFQNVFISSKTENVIYESFARLQVDINCMSDHLDLGEDWKYLLNIPGQEYPLKTNSELVKILKIYNNSNDIEGIIDSKRMLKHKYLYKYINVNSKEGKYRLQKTKALNPAPPHNISIVKGSAYGVFSRDFVNYVINSNEAKDLLNWFQNVKSPDEFFWATLNHNVHLKVPGGYQGKADSKPWLAKFVVWRGVDKCHGKWQRGICIFGVEDLSHLISRKELFANKFIMDYQPLTLQCLSEWLYNKTISPLPFDTHYYRQLPFINNHF